MRAIDQTDFETSNVQYIEFWMQSPFLTGNQGINGHRGDNYIWIWVSISEDVLKDGRKLYENGLNTPNIPAAIDSSSVWGRVPFNAVQDYKRIQYRSYGPAIPGSGFRRNE
ncbi:MAG: hypothetical protein WDM78_05815 [Puia sp.]